MTTNISEVQDGQRPVAPGLSALAEQLVAAARTQGVELTGPGGLLTGLTKRVLEKDKYPAMVTMWERSRAEFVPFLDFPVTDQEVELHHGIESRNARFRQAVRRRGPLPHPSRPRRRSSTSPSGKQDRTAAPRLERSTAGRTS